MHYSWCIMQSTQTFDLGFGPNTNMFCTCHVSLFSAILWQLKHHKSGIFTKFPVENSWNIKFHFFPNTDKMFHQFAFCHFGSSWEQVKRKLNKLKQINKQGRNCANLNLSWTFFGAHICKRRVFPNCFILYYICVLKENFKLFFNIKFSPKGYYFLKDNHQTTAE